METKKSVCKNPWCKSTYTYTTENPPGVCPKCNDFDNSLSGGVTWKDFNYSEPRNDGKAHEINIKIKNYFK